MHHPLGGGWSPFPSADPSTESESSRSIARSWRASLSDRRRGGGSASRGSCGSGVPRDGPAFINRLRPIDASSTSRAAAATHCFNDSRESAVVRSRPIRQIWVGISAPPFLSIAAKKAALAKKVGCDIPLHIWRIGRARTTTDSLETLKQRVAATAWKLKTQLQDAHVRQLQDRPADR